MPSPTASTARISIVGYAAEQANPGVVHVGDGLQVGFEVVAQGGRAQRGLASGAVTGRERDRRCPLAAVVAAAAGPKPSRRRGPLRPRRWR